MLLLVLAVVFPLCLSGWICSSLDRVGQKEKLLHLLTWLSISRSQFDPIWFCISEDQQITGFMSWQLPSTSSNSPLKTRGVRQSAEKVPAISDSTINNETEKFRLLQKFSSCNLSRVNPLHIRINKGFLQKKTNQHVRPVRVSSGPVSWSSPSLEGMLQANAKLAAG